MTLDEAKALLLASGYVLEADDEIPPWTLNMSDTFGWGLAFAETIPEDQLVKVAELFQRFGWGGLAYWVSEHVGLMSEFCDVNRMIQFVRYEVDICRETPDPTRRAYRKICYLIGEAW